MSDGLPTEEQLRRMEQRVMARIRRRAELPKRIAGGTAAAALLVGGLFLLPRLGLSSGGSAGGGGGGSTGQSAASGSGSLALVAYCHTSSKASSEFRSVPVGGGRTVGRAAIDACVAAIRSGQVEPEAGSTSGSRDSSFQREPSTNDLIACFDQRKRLQVFPKDAHPTTLCARNGMTPAH